ncbi:MAG: LemA family protein [Coriobacteriia bacterium]|nr:LemA family protein [Coriobacteriia bacterium]
MKNLGIVLVAIVVVVALVGVMLAGTYNSLVGQDQAVKAGWAQVENQLKRRADLIPNLIETVKGFAAQEKQVIGLVTDARAKLAGAKTPAEAGAASAEMNAALSKLLVVVEAYPQLKSDQNFRDLMYELSGTENRIAVARKDYNGAVNTYNTSLRSFPTVMIAGMFGFQAAEFFQIDEKDAELPKVDFNTSPATSTP